MCSDSGCRSASGVASMTWVRCTILDALVLLKLLSTSRLGETLNRPKIAYSDLPYCCLQKSCCGAKITISSHDATSATSCSESLFLAHFSTYQLGDYTVRFTSSRRSTRYREKGKNHRSQNLDFHVRVQWRMATVNGGEVRELWEWLGYVW